MTSERISTSSSTPGRPPKKTSTISSKLNSQNGSRRLRGVEHLRLVAEAAAVFVVRIDQEDAQVRAASRRIFCSRMRDAARLADAGGAEHGEMPAHQVVDVDVDADAAILLQIADDGRDRGRRRHRRGAVRARSPARRRRRSSDSSRCRAGTAARPRRSGFPRSAPAAPRCATSAAPDGLSSWSTAEINAMITAAPVWMPRNLPTVASWSFARTPVDAPSVTFACPPEIDVTRPMSSAAAGEPVGAICEAVLTTLPPKYSVVNSMGKLIVG